MKVKLILKPEKEEIKEISQRQLMDIAMVIEEEFWKWLKKTESWFGEKFNED
mgnify:CR=1 FL=1